MRSGLVAIGAIMLMLSGAASAQSAQEIQDNIPNEITDNLTRDDIDEYRNRAQETVGELRTFSKEAKEAYQEDNTVQRIDSQCRASNAALSQLENPSGTQTGVSMVVRNTGDRQSNFLVVVETASDELILTTDSIQTGASDAVEVPGQLDARTARVNAIADGVYGDTSFTSVCDVSDAVEVRNMQGREQAPNAPPAPPGAEVPAPGSSTGGQQTPPTPGEESTSEQQTPPTPEASSGDSEGNAEPQDPGIVEQVLGGIL